MKKYLWNLLLAFDQLLNALILGGDRDETMSGRLGKAHRGDYGIKGIYISFPFWLLINSIFYPLEGWAWGHCERSIEEDEGKDDLLF